ncbi:hypothetical protein [Burkholderia cepacia]|uniref:hypothetical protein n=1 Tax=Burkholderia cepacia TaxID=292 RepID=UPI00163A1D20|nr:hypothetical protein [Burkholderia cepacia]
MARNGITVRKAAVFRTTSRAARIVPPLRRSRGRQPAQRRRAHDAGKSDRASHARLLHQNVFSPFR